MTDKKYIFYIIVVVVLVGGVFFYRQAHAPATSSDINTATSTVGTTTSVTSNGLTLDTTGKGHVTIEPVSVGSIKLPPLPALDTPLVFPKNMAQDARTAYTQRITQASAALKKNPKDAEAALELGLYRKVIEDYKGAEAAWIYVTLIAPTDYTAYQNLGDLYGFYLKDYPKSEKNFLKAISLKPNDIPGYASLSSLYKNSYTEKSSQAEQILLDGLKKNPGNKDLQALLDEYRSQK